MARAFIPHHISDDSALGGSVIKNSLRFNANDGVYLSRTPSSAGNRRTWTWSAWIKRGSIGSRQILFSADNNASSATYLMLELQADDNLRALAGTEGVSGATLVKETAMVLRDPLTWYHLVFKFDATNTSAVWYVNGQEITDLNSSTNPSNQDYQVNATTQHFLGRFGSSLGTSYFDGYMAEVNFIDGIALDASYFGYTDFQTGLWRPKGYFGSYNTNGFHLEFKNTSTAASYTVPTASFTTDSDTALLINNNESNGSTTFTDSSSNGYSVSGTGGVSHSTSYSKFGTSSISFDGSNDSLTVGGNGTLYSELTASSNKTYEAFVYHTADDYTYLFSASSNQQYLGMYLNASSGHFGFNGNQPNPYTAVRGDIPGGTIPLNQWNHFFVQRNADGTMTVGFNGSILQNSVAEAANNTTGGTVGPLKIGSQHYYGSSHRYFFEGYMDELRISNTPRYSASYSGTVGEDTSGQGNTFAPNNFTSSDVLSDVPTNNFATLNSVIVAPGSSFKEGNLYFDAADTHKTTYSNLEVSSGKWYWEAKAIKPGSATKWTYGISDVKNICGKQVSGTNYLLAHSTGSNLTYTFGDAVSLYRDALYKNGTSANISGYTIEQNDIVGVALDVDAGKVWFRIGGGIGGSQTAGSWLNGATNNTYSTTFNPYSHDRDIATGETYVAGFSGESSDWIVNFGQDDSFAGTSTSQGNKDVSGLGNFHYAVPSGFRALCTNNLPSEAQYVIRPQKHFGVITYTGSDTSAARTVTGLEFAPDLVWQKRRNGTNWHAWFDTVRGVGKELFSNDTSAETTNNQYGYISAFGTNGFTWSPGSTNNSDGNESSGTFVSWCWKAGGAAVSNSDGSITSQVSANQEAGFSVVTYDGSNDSTVTFGHGLDSAPELVFIKRRNNANGWRVYHHSVGLGKYLSLSNNNGTTTSSEDFVSTSSTTFGVKGGYNPVSINGGTYVAYCWHSVPGYSKIGSFKGTANADGPVVYTGFRPAFILFKNSDTSTNWEIYDTTRPYGVSNPALRPLYANRDYVEETHATLPLLDILSNGFKIRGTWDEFNKDGNVILYMAFAEQPGSTAYATETNAR